MNKRQRQRELGEWLDGLLRPNLTTGLLADMLEDGSDLLGFATLLSVHEFVSALRDYPEDTILARAPSSERPEVDSLIVDIDIVISAIHATAEWKLSPTDEECLHIRHIDNTARHVRTISSLDKKGFHQFNELVPTHKDVFEPHPIDAIPARLFIEFCSLDGLSYLFRCPACGRAAISPVRRDKQFCSDACRMRNHRS